MAGKIAAVLDQIEAQQEATIPEGIGALRLLQMVYQGKARRSASYGAGFRGVVRACNRSIIGRTASEAD